MTQKLLIDADPGIGDALAILIALADPALDVLALTACGGTVSGPQATRNLHYLTHDKAEASAFADRVLDLRQLIS